MAGNRHNPRRALTQFGAAWATTKQAEFVNYDEHGSTDTKFFQGVCGMKKLTVKGKWMIVAVLAIATAGAGVALTAMAQGERRKHESKQEEKAKYHSSVQVQDDKNEREEAEGSEGVEENEAAEANEANESKEGEKGEEADKAEGAESERLKSLARITPEQASAAALAQVPGTVKKIELENEDGNVVYGVEIKTADGESDVKVDAGDGRVLHVEKDGEDD
jgi:uncharacterized membrane protein YkoI